VRYMLLNPTKQENGANGINCAVDESEQRRPFSASRIPRYGGKTHPESARSARSLVWLRPSPGRVRRRQHPEGKHPWATTLKVELTLDDSLRSGAQPGAASRGGSPPERHEPFIDVKRPVSSARSRRANQICIRPTSGFTRGAVSSEVCGSTLANARPPSSDAVRSGISQ